MKPSYRPTFPRACFALGLSLALASALRAETTVPVPATPGSGITLRLATPLTQLPHFGFLPVRAVIENLSTRDGAWDLQFQAGNGGAAAPFSLLSRFALAVPAGQSRETWLYVPVARAGFALNSTGGPGGSRLAPPVGAGAPRVDVVKVPFGTKVTRTTTSPTGRVLMTMETEINETTGEMTLRNLDSSGAALSSRVSRPPPGNSVTYTIDPNTGFVFPRYRTDAGGFSVSVVTLAAGASPAATTTPPKVTITPTTAGTRITRVVSVGSRTTTEETDFDTKAGTITVTRTLPNGAVSTNTRTVPATPGTETTFTINPTTGTYGTQTRLVAKSSALAKMTVLVGAATPPAPVAPFAAGAPAGAPAATTVVAEITGTGFDGTARVALPNGPSANPMRPFAVGVALESDLRAALATEVTGAPNLAAVTVAQLPADWRVWSSFAGVILAADDYAVLDAAHRAALRGWLGLGGQLFLVPAAAGAERTEPVGAGRIVTLAAPLAVAGGPALRAVLNLYGETVALPDRESLYVKGTALGEEIKAEAGDSSWVAIFLVIFAAVIGPVNLFVFAPAKRRHRLFWTTPALALLGGLVLVGVIFFQDGTGGGGRRSALVVLLPGQNQAAVFQEQAARTGFLPRRTFALDDDAVFAPLAPEAESMRFGFSGATATRDAAQAGGDWFRSRATQAHLLRRLAPTRGRVELAGTAPGGAPIVESSLATVLREFVLRDAAGKFWSTGELSPGRRVTLEPARRDAESSALVLGGSAGLTRAYAAATSPVPGRWFAWGGETEIAPVSTLTSVRWAATSIAYTGVAEPPANAPAKGGAQ